MLIFKYWFFSVYINIIYLWWFVSSNLPIMAKTNKKQKLTTGKDSERRFAKQTRGVASFACILQYSYTCTEKTSIPFPFTLNGIWSWWQYSFRFWTKWNSIWFKIERNAVITIISHSMWKEMEYQFSQCRCTNIVICRQNSRHLPSRLLSEPTLGIFACC